MIVDIHAKSKVRNCPEESKNKSFVTFGHPLLDIITSVDNQFLERYACPIGATMLATPEQASLFDDIAKHVDVEFVPGGASMNTCRVCMWLHRGLAVTCSYVGCTAEDNFGKILQKSLSSLGVEANFDTYNGCASGTCACLVVGKERTLVANLGAALHLSLDFVKSEKITKLLSQASIVYCEGFFLNLTANPAVALYVATYCSENDVILSYNLSAPYLCSIFKDSWAQVMPCIDVIFGNRVDFMAYASSQGWDCGDISNIAMRVAILPKHNASRKRIVVLTHGAEPTIVATTHGITEYVTPWVPSEAIVDLNGAGDAFAGGFLAAMLVEASIDDCVKAAQYAAMEVVKQKGCTFPSESKFDFRTMRAEE